MRGIHIDVNNYQGRTTDTIEQYIKIYFEDMDFSDESGEELYDLGLMIRDFLKSKKIMVELEDWC